MSLRLRLIVAFFFLSVVPLAAVTFFTFRTNLEAAREAAGGEARLLAGELSQRMQLVTAQLSQRVERLMTMSAGDGGTPAAAEAKPAAPAVSRAEATGPAPAVQTADAAAAASAMAVREVTDTLGDLAMLINNVEIRPARGGGRGGRGGGGGRGGRGGPPSGAAAQPAAPTGAPAATGVPPALQAPPAAPAAAAPAPGAAVVGQVASAPGGPAPAGAPPTAPVLSADPFASRRGFDPNRGNGGRNGEPRFRDRGNGTGQQGRGEGPPGPPPGPPPDDDPTRIRIDMAPVWREVLQQFVPDGNLEQLSPEERARVFAEVNQRMLGIQQGIQMLQQRVAERVATAQAQTEAVAAEAAANVTAPAPPVPAPAPTAPAPPKPAATPAPPAPAAAPTQQRRTTITDGRLAVRVEQDGELVSQASAEINVANLLATVFTTTKRESGEVPFAIAKDGQLQTQTEADRQTLQGIGVTNIRPDTPAGNEVLPGWVVATTVDPTGLQAKFGVARPMGEAVEDLWRNLALNTSFGLGLIVLALVGIVPLSSRLTRNLHSLSEGVSRISQGDYGARVALKTNDEVGRLASAFNRMAADIEVHQRSLVEQERIRRELELGRQIQHDMLPQVPLRLGLTEVKGVSVPAREVGGDFFNYFQLANGTLALLVGDVSGKGVGAALLMANIQASLRTRLSLGQDLASLAAELDRDIESSTPGPVYATLFVGIFDPATRLLRCVNAGHNPQYVIRSSGALERMDSTGLPIGLMAGHGYTEQRVQLEPGDRLFFYTDGCVEAGNTAGDMFGMDRLEAALTLAAGSEDVLAAVEAEVTRFRAEVELSDDATMMVVKVG